MKIAVCDTSSLIKLNKVGAVGLLSGLFDKIYLPVGVEEECLDKSLRQAIKAPFFEVRKVKNILLLGMGKGERKVISLAVELNLQKIITDDIRAVTKAYQFNLVTFYTENILVLAKEKNLIDSVKLLMDKMKAAGEGIEDDVYLEALQLAKET